MKKITLLLLLVLAGHTSYAQITYFNYLDYTSEWRFYGGGWNGMNGFDSYETRYFDGDETINGVAYYKQYSIAVVTEYNPPFGSTYSTTYNGGPYYIREDTSGKFYQLNQNDGTEEVILDNQVILDTQIGDLFPSPGAGCNVETIQTVNLGTRPLKQIKGINTGNNTGTLEGVGLVGLACAMGIESNSWLNCYTKQGLTITLGTADCNAFPIPLRTGLAISQPSSTGKSILVYPNPTNGLVKITYPSQEATDYEIVSIRGSLLRKGSLEKEESVLDISDFASGIYLIKIGSDSKVYRKIVKQ